MPARPRIAAWLLTGPVGHFYGGFMDWLTLVLRYLYARARGRELV